MKYKGTTVNERLYLSGLMDEFDEVVKRNNIELCEISIKSILLQIGLIPNKGIIEED